MRSLTGIVKNYAWGSPTAIPAILGTVPDETPQAEYWLGAHDSAPAKVDGTTLDRLLADEPQLLGGPVNERFGGKLPFLMKILAAAQPLSLQAHPSAEQAEAGFAAEEARGVPVDDPKRTFKDTWPKPEVLVALSPFEALAGFRDPKRTVALFDELQPREPLESLIGPLRHRGAEAGLAEVFLECLCPDDEHKAMVNGVLAAALPHEHDKSPLGDFARLALRLNEFYPSDPGILAALLLNHFTLKPGQGLRVQADVLHAYVQGTGIEIMASSDNVVRGGLTHKHIDVKALVDLLDFSPSTPQIITPTPVGGGLARYQTPDEQFALWRAELSPDRTVTLPAQQMSRILLVIEGHVDVMDARGQHKAELVQGQSAFFDAGEDVTLKGSCLAFLAAPGLHEAI